MKCSTTRAGYVGAQFGLLAAASVALPHHPIAFSAPPNRFVAMAQSHLQRRASQRSLRFANKGPGVDWGWRASHRCERHSHMLSTKVTDVEIVQPIRWSKQ
jgi:hypothetical protein